MRWSLRLILSAIFLLSVPLFLITRHFADIWNQYNISSYIAATWQTTFRHGAVENIPAYDGKPGDKVIVMAKLEQENTDWVTEELPDWQAAIYTVNPTPNTTSNLTTPLNKGHEAMAYLTYIIDNYATLPSTLAFLHSHRSGLLPAWHTDTPLHSNPSSLHLLRLPFLHQSGYVNLRCNWNPGCLEPHRRNKHVTKAVWEEVWRGTSTEGQGWREDGLVGQACCAQFAVSKEQVRRRPRGDYERLRGWVVETEMGDAGSGRVMEFLWHVVFGKEAVFCPPEDECYCNVYGRC